MSDSCSAQWTFGESGLADPTSADVPTRKKDDVALQIQKICTVTTDVEIQCVRILESLICFLVFKRFLDLKR